MPPNNPNTPPVICLMGPTATGKTEIAAGLCEEYPFEIISVDSSQVYLGMNIGTAKPDADFLERYPHHLVNIREPDEIYSAADFYADARQLIEDIHGRGKIPLLVGGTMFYFYCLEKGLSGLPEADAETRREISERAESLGWPAMHGELQRVDPMRAAQINPNDAQRIQRALEINMVNGQTVGALSGNSEPLEYPLVKVALVFSERQQLHERIRCRFDDMLDAGLVDEVRGLLAQGVDPNLPAMRMIGYRQVIDCLGGTVSISELRERGTAATRQLAKRQLTWLRNQSNVTWFVKSGLNEGISDEISRYIHEMLPELSL